MASSSFQLMGFFLVVGSMILWMVDAGMGIANVIAVT